MSVMPLFPLVTAMQIVPTLTAVILVLASQVTPRTERLVWTLMNASLLLVVPMRHVLTLLVLILVLVHKDTKEME